MKKTFVVCALALVMMLGAVSSAFAATQNYAIVLPEFRRNVYTSAKTVSAHRDFGVKHRYSGGYPVRFVVCNSSRQAIGPAVTVFPNSRASLKDLWWNSSASSKIVVVRMDAGRLNPVKVLAQGTWYWNY